MKGVRLYAYWRSSASWRARIALNWKSVDYEYVPVNLLQGQQLGAEYSATNPMQQLPTLEWQDDQGTKRLSQSLAIVRFLDATIPEPPLEPSDAFARAKAWQLAEIVNAGIQPLQNLSMLKVVEELGGDKKAWGAASIERGLAAMETIASETAGRYLVGSEVSVADLCLVPQLYNGRRFGLDIDRFPTLARVETELSTLPAFANAHADRQPDMTT